MESAAKRARVEYSSDDGLAKLTEDVSRPEAPYYNSRSDTLTFMQTDSSGYEKNGNVRLFGITEGGSSIMCTVTGFRGYFYVHVPPRWGDANRVRLELERKMTARGYTGEAGGILVEEVRRRSIMYYVPGDPMLSFMKITMPQPRLVREAASIFERGLLEDLAPSTTFDATVDFVMRFMCDIGLVGCSWVELPPGKYSVSDGYRRSSVQIEAQIDYRDLVCHKPEGDWLKPAPIRRLSFDIECCGRKGVFPEPELDEVIQIANYITAYGVKDEIARVIFTLKSCAPIAGVQVLSFERETDLLRAWSAFVREVDPDILTGYNVVNFDLPFLLRRAEVLEVSSFPYLGRVTNAKTNMRSTQLSSSAFGVHESKDYSMDGRVVMDMIQIITRDFKLRSYSLNSVSAEFLGEQKEDVHYSIIADLQRTNEQTRRRLATYCLKDAVLPSRLMDRLQSLTNYIEMSRVTGIPLGWLISRGHMIKVVSLLHRKAFESDLVIPDLARSAQPGGGGGGGGGGANRSGGTNDAPQFEGATVIEPLRGYYGCPIATLDFASLYPSIIMAHNLCYSTLLRRSDVARLRPEDYIKTPNGDFFVRSSLKKGVLSAMLEGLLAARKRAKVEMASETDAFRHAVLDGRQVALKISANAVYGFTGATVGKLPCMEISASVTGYGRQMIEATKEQVEALYEGARVVYGDTDSVMVKFGEQRSLAECMELGRDAAKSISARFPSPVRLDFEKCYMPYLLISKKRYAGLLWTNTDSYDKMDTKGVESVRRDNCRLVASVINRVLETLLKERDRDGAVKFVKDVISDLLQNNVDISLLVISKALTRAEADYDAKQAHVMLAEKMRQRDPGSAPTLGDRVPYVITRGARHQAAYERAEDPLYVLKHNLSIDSYYYLENMLRKPLERIFEPVLKGKTAELFSGAHTQKVTMTTPRNGIMKFAKVQLTCLGCKAPLKAAVTGALCEYCKPREAEIYTTYLSNTARLEDNYSALWTECQRCMGDRCQDVYCSNVDCPIFYRRTKTQMDLNDAEAKLARFAIEW